MPIKKYMYHLTEIQNKDIILKQGLLPKIGNRSKAVGERTPCIYLCDRKSLPYWIFILGDATCILKMPINQLNDLQPYQYSIYSEYTTDTMIAPEHITPAPYVITKQAKDAARDALRCSYLDTISYIALRCARYYNQKERDAEMGQRLNSEMDTILPILQRLDYENMPRAVIRRELKETGESGEYTFLDTYLSTKTRLYERLIHYPNDDLSEIRAQWYQFIKQAFKGCLTVNTGGWTG